VKKKGDPGNDSPGYGAARKGPSRAQNRLTGHGGVCRHSSCRIAKEGELRGEKKWGRCRRDASEEGGKKN